MGIQSFVEKIRYKTELEFPTIYHSIDRNCRISWSDVSWLCLAPQIIAVALSLMIEWYYAHAIVGFLSIGLLWVLVTFDVVAMPWEYDR